MTTPPQDPDPTTRIIPPTPPYAAPPRQWPPQPVPPQQGGWQNPAGVVAPPAPNPEIPPVKRSRKKIVLVSLAVLVAIGALAGGGYAAWYNFIRVPQINVYGTMFLYSTNVSSAGGCSGKGGYSDISDGTAVVIRDASGTTIGTTELVEGSKASGGCTFSFYATVPGKSEYYSVEVSHRGEVQLDKDEIKIPMISLGK